MIRNILALFIALLAATAARAAVAAPPIEDYGKLPSMELVRLSPSGARYAFIATVGEKRRLVVATTGNQPLEVQDVGRAKVEALEWAGEDHLLVHTSATVELGMRFTVSKNELGSVIVIDLKAHRSFAVFANPYETRVAQTVVGSYGTAQIGDHWYGFFGGYSYEADQTSAGPKKDYDGVLYADLYKVDLDSGAFTITSPGQSGVRGWLVSPAGDIAARLIYDQRGGVWRLKSPAYGDLASGRAPTGRISVLGFGRTPQTVLIRVAGSDHDVTEELPIGGAGPATTFDSDETGPPLFDPVSSLWIGSMDRDNEGASTLFEPARQAKLRGALKAFPGYIPRLVSYSADFNHLIVLTEGGDDSGTYWLIDIAKGAASIIGQVHPTIGPQSVGPVRWVDYKAADGLAMRGVLTLPPGRAAVRLPLVVMPHGGPESHDRLGFDWWAEAFAAQGYAVFQPNFRGSDGSGNKFRDAGFGQWGRKMQTDISDGMAALAKQGLVDPQRACIVGGSYGGYAALAGVTLQHGLYRCAVAYGGVADLSRMLTYERQRTSGFSATTRYWREFMGVTSTWETELNDISPIRQADRADAPVLLIHGKEDTVVTIDQSEAMAGALRRAGKPVELITLPGADHWLLEEDARVAMLKASVAFVLKHNPPDDPTAVAAAH